MAPQFKKRGERSSPIHQSIVFLAPYLFDFRSTHPLHWLFIFWYTRVGLCGRLGVRASRRLGVRARANGIENFTRLYLASVIEAWRRAGGAERRR